MDKVKNHKTAQGVGDRQTPVNEPGEATSRVLALPELLEHILGFLPFRDLLLVQDVNKTFRHAISTSIKLQRKLHLTPDKTAAVRNIPILPDEFFESLPDEGGRIPLLGVYLRLHSTKRYTWDFRGNGASWRKMFATQPPTKESKLMLACFISDESEDESEDEGEDGSGSFQSDDFVSEAGITLGQMVDHAYAMAACFSDQRYQAIFDLSLREEDLLR